jgi:hypothetical protein
MAVKEWTFRHFALLILLINITFLSWTSEESKLIYFDLAKIAVGGYLGQLLPQGTKL